ncbi:SprT-like domain-containing protein [Algoriphagus namhaensis]
MSSPQKFQQILSPYVPSSALDYCVQLWSQTPFSFHITKERKSKLGDFRFRPDRKIQTITINGNLNPYQFLLTFIHEYAHLQTFEQYGRNTLPHGKEWKRNFQQLMSPLLQEGIFPRNVLIPLRAHMRSPKASSATDLFLMKEMSSHDLKEEQEELFLADLNPETEFYLSGRKFLKKETRRTRALCIELSSQREYYVSLMARVRLTLPD